MITCKALEPKPETAESALKEALSMLERAKSEGDEFGHIAEAILKIRTQLRLEVYNQFTGGLVDYDQRIHG